MDVQKLFEEVLSYAERKRVATKTLAEKTKSMLVDIMEIAHSSKTYFGFFVNSNDEIYFSPSGIVYLHRYCEDADEHDEDNMWAKLRIAALTGTKDPNFLVDSETGVFFYSYRRRNGDKSHKGYSVVRKQDGICWHDAEYTWLLFHPDDYSDVVFSSCPNKIFTPLEAREIITRAVPDHVHNHMDTVERKIWIEIAGKLSSMIEQLHSLAKRKAIETEEALNSIGISERCMTCKRKVGKEFNLEAGLRMTRYPDGILKEGWVCKDCLSKENSADHEI